MGKDKEERMGTGERMKKLTLMAALLTANITDVHPQPYEHPQRLYLRIGYLSEVRIPEPYLKVKPSVPIVEIDDIEGLNKQVITVQPVTAERGETNLRIYTRSYAFNVKVVINDPSKEPTSLLDLGANVRDFEKLQTPPENNGESHNDHIRTDTVDVSDFSMTSLLNAKNDLLKPNPYCFSISKNRVTLAVDHIFYHKGKIVFKISLYNRSNVPYGIADLTIKYIERKGIKFINRRETKSMVLKPYHEGYTTKKIEAGGVGHIIYVVDKIGTKDNGRFNFVLREENGNRTFNLAIPSYIN